MPPGRYVVKEDEHPLSGFWGGRGRRNKAASGKCQHSVDLFARHVELLDDFFHGRAGFDVLEHSGDRHPGIAKHPRATHSSWHTFNGGTLRPVERCHDKESSFLCECFREFGGRITRTPSTASIAGEPAVAGRPSTYPRAARRPA